MLKIVVPGMEYFDDDNNEFVKTEDFTLELEHSLVSLSKWESKHEKPFLGKGDRTDDEVIDYVKCMVLTPEVPPDVFLRLSRENIEAVGKYIDSKQTATWFNENIKQKPSNEVITSELVYSWMVALQVPFECQYWHLNRLFTLIRIINLKNQPKKKMSRAELAAQNRALNEQRKAQLGTTG